MATVKAVIVNLFATAYGLDASNLAEINADTAKTDPNGEAYEVVVRRTMDRVLGYYGGEEDEVAPPNFREDLEECLEREARGDIASWPEVH